jgi:hypothetical protein
VLEQFGLVNISFLALFLYRSVFLMLLCFQLLLSMFNAFNYKITYDLPVSLVSSHEERHELLALPYHECRGVFQISGPYIENPTSNNSRIRFHQYSALGNYHSGNSAVMP